MVYRIWFKSEMKVVFGNRFRGDEDSKGDEKVMMLKMDYKDRDGEWKQINLIFDKNSYGELEDLSFFVERAKRVLLSKEQIEMLERNVKMNLKDMEESDRKRESDEK